MELKSFGNATEEELETGLRFRVYKPYMKNGNKINNQFRFFYQGGLNIKKTEEFYTLTTFYLAQANVKSGDKDKAANWCGITLQRNYDSGQADVSIFEFLTFSIAN